MTRMFSPVIHRKTRIFFGDEADLQKCGNKDSLFSIPSDDGFNLGDRVCGERSIVRVEFPHIAPESDW